MRIAWLLATALAFSALAAGCAQPTPSSDPSVEQHQILQKHGRCPDQYPDGRPFPGCGAHINAASVGGSVVGFVCIFKGDGWSVWRDAGQAFRLRYDPRAIGGHEGLVRVHREDRDVYHAWAGTRSDPGTVHLAVSAASGRVDVSVRIYSSEVNWTFTSPTATPAIGVVPVFDGQVLWLLPRIDVQSYLFTPVAWVGGEVSGSFDEEGYRACYLVRNHVVGDAAVALDGAPRTDC